MMTSRFDRIAEAIARIAFVIICLAIAWGATSLVWDYDWRVPVTVGIWAVIVYVGAMVMSA